jgi:hypothetical protein
MAQNWHKAAQKSEVENAVCSQSIRFPFRACVWFANYHLLVEAAGFAFFVDMTIIWLRQVG